MSFLFVLAVAVVLALLLFLYQLSRPDSSRPHGKLPAWKRNLRIAFAGVLLVIIALGVWAFIIEPNRLMMRHEAVQIDSRPEALAGLRIAVIADIHAGSPFINEQKLQRIVALTNEQKPDLIVILGDFVVRTSWHGTHMEPEVIVQNLKGLQAPLGVFAVLGNHDWWEDGRRMWSALESAGIRVLENDVARVERNGSAFWLAGLGDFWTRPQRIHQTLAPIPEGQPIIALTHNPDIFSSVPARVPLTLAGHTHGGQVNFPILGRIVLPSDHRYAAGFIREGGHQLFVTTGIGTSIFPVRFRVPPEIVILTINP